MADLSKTIAIIFSGVDQLSSPLKSMSGQINKFGSDVSAIGDPFHQVTKGVLALDAAIIAMTAGGLAYSIAQFATFEDRMLKVKGVIGATEEEYQMLTDMTKELGATTRYTAEEAAAGLEFLALAGMDTVTAMAALPEVLNLAAAAGLGLKETADIATNIMAGFGIAATELGKTNDVLTATFTNSNTSLHQLGEAFKFVGPVAKSLGFTIEETAAVLGVLGNAGYQAEKGGTALRNIMLALVAPAGNMGKLMKELGVDTTELGVDFASSRNALDSLGVVIKSSTGEILPFSNILGQIKTGLEQIPDPADRTATLIEIFGKRGGPQLAALLNQGVFAVTNLETKIKSLGGITSKIAAEMESGMGGIQRALVSAFNAIAIEVGEKSAEAIEDGARSMVDVIRVISNEVDSGTFKPLFDLLEQFSDQLGSELDVIAKNLPAALKGVDFSQLVDSLKSLAGVFGSVFDDVDLTSVEGLRTTIQNVVNSLTKLTYTTKGIAEILIEVAKVIYSVVENLKALDSDDWEIVGNLAALGTALTGLATVIAVGGALVAGMTAFAGLFASGGILAMGMSGIIALMTGPVGIAVGLAALLLSFSRASVAVERYLRATSTLKNSLVEYAKLTGNEKILENVTKLDDKTAAAAGQFESLSHYIQDFPDEVKTSILATFNEKGIDAALAEVGSYNSSISGIPAEKETKLKAESDAQSFARAANALSLVAPDEKETVVKPKVNEKDVVEANKDLDEIHEFKMVEIQLQGDIDIALADIKANADMVQTAFEWTAKLDIAQIEADAKQVAAAFDAAASSVSATAAAAADMFSSLVGNWGDIKWASDRNALMSMVQQQIDLEKDALSIQRDLTEAQIEYMQAKSDALKNGDGLIKIESDGLEPALEMIMWQILEKVQLRVTEEAAEFLLGLGVTS